MTLNPAKLLTKQGKTALFICDVQPKFSKVIFEFDKMVKNTATLISACKLIDVPMLVSEHLPASFGSTVPEFDISGAEGLFSKTQLSMCTPEVKEALLNIDSGKKIKSALLVGLEAHLCVEHTAIDLCLQGIQVHAVSDCISAKNQEEKLQALNRMKQFGCVITTMESAIFKLVPDTSNELFKKLLPLVRPPNIEPGLVSPKL